jgi:6-phosphogluconolactonase
MRQLHRVLFGRFTHIKGPSRGLAVVGLVGLGMICAAARIRANPDEATTSATGATAPIARSSAVELDQKLISEAKSHSEIMANLGYLSDVIGPRLTGSANLKRANEWTAEKLKSYGLTNVHLEAWTIPMGWERGSVYARLLEPDNGRTLLMASMGWAPGTKGRITGDVVAIKATNSKELQAYKGKLHGAIILQSRPLDIQPVPDKNSTMNIWGTPGRRRNDAGGRNQAGRPRGAPGGRDGFRDFRAMMAFRRELSEFLRSEGVAAMLMDSAKPQGLLNMTGSWASMGGRDRASSSEPIPTLFVAHEHYALLYRLASRPEPARTRIELEVSNKFIPGPIAVYNTIAEIKGSEKPDECVILGAHLDSWDLGTGTTDNGTGSSVVLEAARILAKSGVTPKRTIRFILFSGEEEGLFGSGAYVKQHKDELPRISMCLVHDTGTGKVTGLGLQQRQALKPIFDRELTSLKAIGLENIDLRSMPGSDHQSFDSEGVPGLCLQQDMSEYNWTHHSQSDTLDKAHEDNLVQGAQVMAVVAMRVANLPELLPHGKPASGPFDFAAIHGGRRVENSEKQWVYVGTYSGDKSKGIYRMEFDHATGKLSAPKLAAEARNPSFLALHPSHRFLYAVNEVDEADGKKGGAVSAFAIDQATGDLKLLNLQSTGGAGPCHVAVDRAGTHVLVANYGSGSASVLPIDEEGKLGRATAVVQHEGSSVDPGRQSGPHAHSINLDQGNAYAVVADLGLDKVMVYRYDPDKGALAANDPPAANVAAGSGPRHFAFHRDGRHAYVVNELNSTVTAFEYDPAHGALKTIQTVSAVPKEFSGKSYCAEIQVHPSGKFVYCSNRGHDSIAVFGVDPKTGLLTLAGHQGDHIKTPRNFAFDASGDFLLVANQDSDSVVVFRINPETGRLAPQGDPVAVPVPVCLKAMGAPTQ